MTLRRRQPRTSARPAPRERGVAAIIAMMFLVIFGSLAAAMAIVSQGGLRSAESHLKIGRAHAAAETGLDLLEWRIEQAFAGRTGDAELDPLLEPVRSDQGVIDAALAERMWEEAAANLADILVANAPLGGSHHQDGSGGVRVVPVEGTGQTQVLVGAIRVGAGQPDFEARIQPHPIPTEDYSGAHYDRMPYGPPGGDPAGSPWQQSVYAQDVALKEAAGIDYVVGDPEQENGPVQGYPVRKLDARFLRIEVTGTDRGTYNAAGSDGQRTVSRDGAAHSVITRTLRQDYRLTKTIPFALLSRSRIMIGRNVSVDGPLNSRFSEVNLDQGHPVQMESDLLGFDAQLDADLASLATTLSDDGRGHDLDNDNRINLNSPSETDGLWARNNEEARRQFIRENDLDGDGYLSEFDFFVKAFDGKNGGTPDGTITREEFGIDGDGGDPSRRQLFQLINLDASPDTYVDENGVVKPKAYPGEPDGLNARDRYAKVRGQVRMEATLKEWDAGAASESGSFHNHLQGPITPDFGERAIADGDARSDELYEFGADSFDMAAYHLFEATVLTPENAAAADVNDASRADEVVRNGRQVDVTPEGGGGGEPVIEYRDGREAQEGEDLVYEEVPYQSTYAYDHFDRPVYRNLKFRNARIPAGTNALFEDCLFTGITYVETAATNDDENFNYAGIQDADGVPTYWDRPVEIGGVKYGGDGTEAGDRIEGTKLLANNLRFHNCTFQGPLAGGPVGGGRFPADFAFTHTRNKVTFTGRTRWDMDGDTSLSDAQRSFFKRSSILMPHFSVEVGSFKDPASLTEEVRLEGTVVAGIIDIRGQAEIHGTIVTTFEPESGQGPVVGDTSPNFNTTLGYFGRDQGDFESNREEGAGLGRIRLRYNPLATLPDGINSPITLVPLPRTFSE